MNNDLYRLNAPNHEWVARTVSTGLLAKHQKQKEGREKPTETTWAIQRKFALASEGYNAVSMQMKKGQRLEGEVASTGTVDVCM